jgi:hypothetical protein
MNNIKSEGWYQFLECVKDRILNLNLNYISYIITVNPVILSKLPSKSKYYNIILINDYKYTDMAVTVKIFHCQHHTIIIQS